MRNTPVRIIYSFFLSLFFAFALTACPGGGGENAGGAFGSGGGDGDGDGDGDTTVLVSNLTLLSTAPELPSGSASVDDGVGLSAIATDANGNLVAGATVGFSAPGAAVQVTQGVTDSNGLATAVLTTGGNATNRTVEVSATATASGVESNKVPIAIVGTTLQINGPLIVGSGDTEDYQLLLRDSTASGISGATIDVVSSLGNPLSASAVVTNFSGQATVSYTGNTGGSDQLSATSSGVSTSLDIAVSDSKLEFLKQCSDGQDNDTDASTDFPADAQCNDVDDNNESKAAPEPIFDFAAKTILTVRFSSAGVPIAGRTVQFVTTRGDFDDVAPGLQKTVIATDNGDGTYSVEIVSDGTDGAGGAVVTATEMLDGATATTQIVLRATTPAKVDLQASPATIPVSSSSTLTAVVRDAANNLVANQVVNFTLVDSTGGNLSAAQGTTNSQGLVTVSYQASPTPSATDGVKVTASPDGFPGITKTAAITVGGQALFITLGTGNEIEEDGPTKYKLPFAAVVTDSAGNPAPPNTVFRLEVVSVAYQKGAYLLCIPPWVASYTIPGPNLTTDFALGCPNEDVNNNGILDPGEDANANGTLEPGNVVTVPATVPLADDGTAEFELTYPQDRTNWIKVKLRAIASVAGTESVSETSFVLPGLASDFNDCTISPPGPISPYGTGGSCATTANAQCSDGLDNDGDGFIDSADPSCSNVLDDSETLPAECSDGLDNDGDSLVDAADGDCTGPADNAEAPPTQCSDGIDNDFDGFTDFPFDGECASLADDDETV